MAKKNNSFLGQKAIAVYTLLLLVIALIALTLGNGLLTRSGNDSIERDNTSLLRAPNDRVLVAESIVDLRRLNQVRELRYEEQTMNVDRLSGIYGAALARVFDRNARFDGELMRGVTLQRDPSRWKGVVEIHKTNNGRVSIVGFVDDGTVARLTDESKAVGTLYFYHEAVREGLVPVAIPVSRVVDWNYRAPHEFSEIAVDLKNEPLNSDD